ncbi:MAG: triose-phosphate isomerase [Myxococcota bacterium]
MPRRPLIAGNWKMNKTVKEALALVSDLKRLLTQVRDRDIVVIPPYTALYPVVQRLEESNIQLGAQELFAKDWGAYTGAVSAPMLAEIGCTHVLVAHSERRQYFAESNASANERVKAALKHNLVPILCIGETLEERDAQRTMDVIATQLDGGIEGLGFSELGRLVVAYEPVWAIGTGKVASSAQAQEVHHFIRERIRQRDTTVAADMRLLYGGSVKPDNAAELFAQPDIDGGLVGGASLNATDFAAIVKAK